MKARPACMVVLMIVFLLPAAFSVCAQPSNPQQTLNQYVADLQKNPNDSALRETIIRYVQKMGAAPTIPEEARRHYVMAKTLSDEAKKLEDFNDAIAEFRGALLVAPWWAEANRDFGLTLEAAQRFDEAITYIKLYMATNPGSDRTRAAQDEIYKIEAKKKLVGKAAKESSPEAMAENKRQEERAFLKRIEGARYKYYRSDDRDAGYWILDVRGNQIVRGYIITSSRFSPEDVGRYQNDGAAPLDGREFSVISPKATCSFKSDAKVVEKGRISDDGESITTQVCNETRTYRRER